MAFFLEGVAHSASEAEQSIVAIATLVASDRRRLLESPKSGPATYRLFEMLPMMPRFTVERARQMLNTSFPTASVAEVLAQLTEGREALVITQNGEAKAVIQDVASYVETQETLALLKILALGTAEVEAGQVRPVGEVVARLRAKRAPE